jgi:DNA-binding PadR family transcriptional regulator
VYVTLERMQTKGFVESRQDALSPESIGLPRRLYRITGLGTTTLAEWKQLTSRLRVAWQGSR